MITFLLLTFCACAPKDPKEVLARVDERIYYPQNDGLTGLFCQVDSPYIREMFDRIKQEYPASKEFLDQLEVEVRFYWKKGAGARFVIKGLPKEPPALRESVWHIFKGTDILVIPPTEQEQFEGLLVSLKKTKGKLELLGINPDPKSDLRQYDLVLAPRKWLPVLRRFYGNGYVSFSRLEYQIWRGKRSLVKIDTFKDTDADTDFQTQVELEYQEIKGFRLVKRIFYQTGMAKTGNIFVGPIELIFEDCITNPPMPIDVFATGEEVSFTDPEVSPAPGSTIPREKAQTLPSEKPR